VSIKLIRGIFFIGALYDGVIGVMGILQPNLAFEIFTVTPPNHPAYVQFPALMLLIFAAMFFQVARDPGAWRSLMLYGVALKAAYSGIVFSYALTSGIPGMWVPWAWLDLGFLVLFLGSWYYSGSLTRPTARH